MMARAAVLAAAPFLSGCAAMFGGYDLAPNGLPAEEEALRRSLAFQPGLAYAEVIGGERPLPEDDLLRLLYAGAAGHYAGAFDESSRLLDVASYLAEDRVTFSVSREALSLVTSDRSLAYTPAPTERLMIPYVAALNYLKAGDSEGAAVEARRVEALLDQFTADDPMADADRRFLHYFAGVVFEAAGDRGAAEVSYRRAGSLAGSGSMAGSLAGSLAGSMAESLGPGRLEGLPPGDSTGDVVILVEQGFVPHRVEQSVVVVLPAEQARMLTEGSAGEKAAAAAAAAARILLTASAMYGDRSDYYRDRGYRSPMHLDPWRDECPSALRGAEGAGASDVCDDGDPYLLRLSWPVLYQGHEPAGTPRVRAGDLGVDAAARLDLSAATRADFRNERTSMLARTVIRAAAKMGLSHSIGEAVSDSDETAGRVAGLLTNLGTLLTERADTRTWHLLPGAISMARIRLPAGEHELHLELDGESGGGLSLGTIRVRPGSTTVLSTRLWR